MAVMPEKVPVAKGGMVVCILTLIASNGQRATSAMSSADADAARYTAVLYFCAASGPTTSLYVFLKYSYPPYLKAPCAEYPKNVGPHPVYMPRNPSARAIFPQAWKLPV